LTSHTQLVLKLAEVFDYPCKWVMISRKNRQLIEIDKLRGKIDD
jgi:hypothetical protein